MFGGVQPPAYRALRSNSEDVTRTSWLQRLGAFFTHYSTKLWRGGFRLSLNLTIFILGVLLLVGLFPHHVNHSYQTIINWTNPLPDETFDLRIVVFGSQDLSGSAIDGHADKERKSWTQRLCQELKCSTYLSMVPGPSAGPALTSNGIYSNYMDITQSLHNSTDVKEHPAKDVKYLQEQYPVSDKIPDLDAQIEQFLSMPANSTPPRQTLWVFTFGTWDIWNLAAFPRKSGDAQVEALVAFIFTRIEKLYLKSLNPESAAFSDFWTNMADADIKRLTDSETAVDPKRLENFRVLIPELFDITLSPAWAGRLDPPLPHTKSEQMRNAAYLTKRWNKQVNDKLYEWTAKGQSQPENLDSEGIAHKVRPESTASGFSVLKYLPSALRLSSEAKKEDDVLYAPYPRRSGVQSPSIKPILDIMTEEGMQQTGTHDGNGRGTEPESGSMRFPDVWTPCTSSGMKMSWIGGDITGQCDVPKNHLFHDRFTINQRAIDNVAKEAAKQIRQDLFYAS